MSLALDAAVLGPLLRLAGASLLVLVALHAVLWRVFAWSVELGKLSPLTDRVFRVHLFFLLFVLSAIGLLSLLRPDLLLARSELGRLLLGAIALFWAARLLAQSLVFDPVLTLGGRWLRVVAHLGWTAYLVVYGAAFLAQLS